VQLPTHTDLSGVVTAWHQRRGAPDPVSLGLAGARLSEVYDRAGHRQFAHGKALVAELAIAPGEHVLDVGCGTGVLAAHVAELVGPTGRVIGIDPLHARIEIASRRAADHVSFQLGRAENLAAFDDESFDVVYLNNVLHWVNEPRLALAEAHRVLRPGGRLGICTAASERPPAWHRIVAGVFTLGGYSDRTPGLLEGRQRASQEELRALLVQARLPEARIELRAFTDEFRQPDEVFEFSLASSSTHFLSGFDVKGRDKARAACAEALEAYRDGELIRLERNLVLAIAHKRR
jgi:SAM-dependent methyltransferase